jgi:hypothetical protein
VRARRTAAFVVLVFLAASVLAASAIDRGSAPVEPSLPAAGDPVPDLSGTWMGMWSDTLFFVDGPMEWEVTQDGSSFSATGTCDLSAVSGALGAAEPFTATGTISGSTLTLTFEFTAMSNLTSDGDGTLTGTGADNLAGTGNVGAPLGFGDYTYTATVTGSSIDGGFDYTVGGSGTITMTKTSPVEAESWAGVKGRFRD